MKTLWEKEKLQILLLSLCFQKASIWGKGSIYLLWRFFGLCHFDYTVVCCRFVVCEEGLKWAISPFPNMLGASRLKYKLHLKATVHLPSLISIWALCRKTNLNVAIKLSPFTSFLHDINNVDIYHDCLLFLAELDQTVHLLRLILNYITLKSPQSWFY